MMPRAGRLVAATQVVQGLEIEVAEQLALPLVPDLGAGAADVGVGQQVECGQAAGIADQAGEPGDYPGIRQILLLRDLRHDQVMAHKPDDEFRVLGVKPVPVAELVRIDGAQFRVIAAAALGDVVEDRRHVEQPRLVEFAHGARAERVFVGELAHREAPEVAQDLQDVLVDGVDVEKIVLHLADDAAERREVGAEDVELVHPAEFVDDAAGALEKLQEGGAVLGSGAELRRDQLSSRATVRAACARPCHEARGFPA